MIQRPLAEDCEQRTEAFLGHEADVESLLQNCQNLDARTNDEGKTALHFAAQMGHSEVMGVLLEAGADFKLVDDEGSTALHLAAWHCRPQCLKLLLEAGADPDVVEMNGLTTLHVAADHIIWNGHPGHFQALIRCCTIDARDQEGASALHYTAADGGQTLVKFLLDAANKDVAQNDGKTPLHLAAEYERQEVVSQLLAAGANEEICLWTWQFRVVMERL